MSRDAASKKPRPAGKKVAPKAADKPLGWFERLKRLRLRFKRKGFDVQVSLVDPDERLTEVPLDAVAANTSEAAVMSVALKAVLDRHPSARKVLAHLAVLEKALGRHGLKALDELPPEVMLRAMSQLETLVTDWSQVGLAGLRARVTASLVQHDRANKRGHSAPDRLSDFQDSKRLQVDEASVSTFMAVNAQWGGSLGDNQGQGAPPITRKPT